MVANRGRDMTALGQAPDAPRVLSEELRPELLQLPSAKPVHELRVLPRTPDMVLAIDPTTGHASARRGRRHGVFP
jgi:hypothetical protein